MIKKSNLLLLFTILFILLLLPSCGILRYKNKVVSTKYREKNQINILNIDSSVGNITIAGWSKDLIEIETRKILLAGLKTDLNLLDVSFTESTNQLNIKSKVPARINGKIDLRIYIPFDLLKIYIDANKGDIKISDFLGDIEVKNNSGKINLDFYGSLLRIDSIKSKINLNIKSSGTFDVMLKNTEGDTWCYINYAKEKSFVDVDSENGNINFQISKKIDHNFLINSTNKKINIFYKFAKKDFWVNNYYMVSGKRGLNTSTLNLDISNINGKILLNEF